MNFEIIVAHDLDNVIGINSSIPWNISPDMKRFRDLTMNNIVIMGRKTYESLPNGKLKNRINIVITQNYKNYISDNELIFTNLENIYSLLEKINYTNKKIFIIGGSQIYSHFLPLCTKIHLTKVYLHSKGDIYFNYNLDNFILLEESMILHFNDIEYKYITYVKKLNF